jgi:hypothetical protein
VWPGEAHDSSIAARAIPGTSLKQTGEAWFVHSDDGLSVTAGESDRFVILAINPADEKRTGFRSADRDLSRREP